MRDFLRQNGE